MKSAREFAHDLLDAAPCFSAFYELTSARDAEHRAELDAAQRTIEQLGKDAAAMATENERLKGELAEARRLCEEVAESLDFVPSHECAGWDCARCSPAAKAGLIREAFAAPPPAESTPVQRDGPPIICDTPGCGGEIPVGGEGDPEICPACLARMAAEPAQPAPPDDIRWRLRELETGQQQHRGMLDKVFSRLAALEAKADDRCAYCGRARANLWHKVTSDPGTHAFVERAPQPAPRPPHTGQRCEHGHPIEACDPCWTTAERTATPSGDEAKVREIVDKYEKSRDAFGHFSRSSVHELAKEAYAAGKADGAREVTADIVAERDTWSGVNQIAWDMLDRLHRVIARRGSEWE